MSGNPFDTLSVRDLSKLGSLNPVVSLAMKRLLIASYEEFVDVLYLDLDACLKYIIETRNHRREESEDRTTVDIIGQLRGRNYDAKHDEQRGGHCDIVVSHPNGYTWIAECKIHGGYDYLKQGFDQLCTRYLAGSPNEDHGSLIIFVRNVDCAAVVQEWRKRVGAAGYDNFTDEDCPIWQQHGFQTRHTGAGSGRSVKIRHTALSLYFDPLA